MANPSGGCFPASRSSHQGEKQLVELLDNRIPGIARVLRGCKRRGRQIPAAAGIAIEVLQSLGNAFHGYLSHLQDGKRGRVVPADWDEFAASAPQLATGGVVRNNLRSARGTVLKTDQPPTFAHRGVDAHVA